MLRLRGMAVVLLALATLSMGQLAAGDMLDFSMLHLFEDKGWFEGSHAALFSDVGGGGSSTAADAGAHPGATRLRSLLNHIGSAVYAATHHEAEPVVDTATLVKFDHTTAVSESSEGQRPELRARCRHTRGTWCARYDTQQQVPTKPVPRGSTPCKADCNNVGNCNYDTGVCDCPAGWTGEGCLTPDKRPCQAHDREPRGSSVRSSHIDKDGRDLGWELPGWRASRCAGICDDDLAMCWCDGKNDKWRHIRASKGSPPGTPPVQRGRPLSEYCGKVQEDSTGRKTGWGNVPYSKVYGPEGWCETDVPVGEGICDSCQVDDLDGRYCEITKEAYCPAQCSGHGDCNLGFCKCHTAWYGLDCSRKMAGSDMEPSDAENGRKPWLKTPGYGVLPPAGLVTPSAPTRKRPLIYVYDVPPAFTTRMLQYRLVWKSCIWRRFKADNSSETHDWLYGVETYFHEILLLSKHRTFDPEEADYFYVPLYVTCYFWPIIGWADHPWWNAPIGDPRPMHGANMMTELKQWLQKSFPYWDRRGGRDHIWLTAADEGACWMPKEIYDTSIILTHWGRLDPNHTSNTAFFRDNYNRGLVEPTHQPIDWTESIKGHACYDPKKDLVIPSLKLPSHFNKSPLLGNAPFHRDILLFFRGDVGERRDKHYSRGIRQKLYKLSLSGWRDEHNIWIMGGSEPNYGTYSSMLARAVFCLVAPGDGWSARLEDSILHGCIPLIIQDGVHTVFETILDYDAFSVRIKEASIENIPTILKAIPKDQVKRMQGKLTKVWHRFAYASGALIGREMNETISRNMNEVPATAREGKVPPDYPIQRVEEYLFQDDAFGTIMQWLYSKIPETRGP